jgi:hypothetical protein
MKDHKTLFFGNPSKYNILSTIDYIKLTFRLSRIYCRYAIEQKAKMMNETNEISQLCHDLSYRDLCSTVRPPWMNILLKI